MLSCILITFLVQTLGLEAIKTKPRPPPNVQYDFDKWGVFPFSIVTMPYCQSNIPTVMFEATVGFKIQYNIPFLSSEEP